MSKFALVASVAAIAIAGGAGTAYVEAHAGCAPFAGDTARPHGADVR